MRPSSVCIPAVVVLLLFGLTTLPSGYTQSIIKQGGAYAYLPLVMRSGPTAIPANTRTPTTSPTVTPSRTLTPSTTPTPSKTASPSSTVTASATQTAVPAPSTVFGISQGSYVGTDFVILGEVTNVGNATAYGTRVAARFLDSQGQLVAVDEANTLLAYLPPGTSTPYKIVLTNAPTGITQFNLTSSWDLRGLDWRTITVVSQQVRNNGGLEVFGELRNDQNIKVNSVRVVITFYQGENIAGVEISYLSRDFAPFTTGVYRVTTTLTASDFDAYVVQAEGYTN